MGFDEPTRPPRVPNARLLFDSVLVQMEAYIYIYLAKFMSNALEATWK